MIKPQILRQALFLSGVTLSSLSDGFIFGQMSGMISALAAPDSEIPLTGNQISWIAATINATCVCGFALATVLSERWGRRRTLTALSTPIIGIWLMLYFAQDYTTFLISRILVGLFFGGVIFNVLVATGEYTSPNERGFWINVVNSGGTAIGTLLGHVLGIVFHWRTVALIGIIPTGISALLPCFWVESPSWLAEKGRYKECEESFKALHGHKPDADMELQLLIEVEKLKNAGTKKSSFINLINKLAKVMKEKYFWKLAMLTCIISLYRVAAGKILFSTLAVTMLQEITGRDDLLMFTLLVDGFLVIGAFLSCFFISKMKMRTLLFSSGIVANIFLSALSACLYFKPVEDNVYFPWINCTLLALYFISVNSGPYPVLETLFGEIFPLDIKGSCIFLFGTFGSALQFLAIRFTPNMFSFIGYHGVFLVNGLIMSLCLVYLWIFLPETKGRTLQEIELYFKNNTFDKAESVRKNEQVKVLI